MLENKKEWSLVERELQYGNWMVPGRGRVYSGESLRARLVRGSVRKALGETMPEGVFLYGLKGTGKQKNGSGGCFRLEPFLVAQ